ncbi:MAG: hypothetical protein LBI05_09655 [Planctomycetaceae bacterium]|jgi:hypothetical protein|nr:hypothetical protein [Planctomycetaceae bacterium]
MNVVLLGILWVLVMPLVAGVLLAPLLREVYIRHPLPLGGALVLRWWNPPKQAIAAMRSASVPEASDENAESSFADAEDSAAVSTSPTVPPEEMPSAVSEIKPNDPPPSGISVFDGKVSIPEGIAVSNVLNAMTSEAPADNLDGFESIIDKSAQAKTTLPEDDLAGADEMNLDDLQALADALQGTKIDFSQELDTVPDASSAEQSALGDVLGENFDFDALDNPAQQTQESLQSPPPADSTSEEEPVAANSTAADSADVALDVQENGLGIVQVSSPFIAHTLPQLTDVAAPETVLPTFPNDWIHESGGTVESGEGDIAKFCFTEESRPMFVRKKKKV